MQSKRTKGEENDIQVFLLPLFLFILLASPLICKLNSLLFSIFLQILAEDDLGYLNQLFTQLSFNPPQASSPPSRFHRSFAPIKRLNWTNENLMRLLSEQV
jgi:hypothetical protein